MKDRLGGIDAIIFNIITPNTWLFGSERTVTDTTMRLLLATSCQNILMVETQKCERLESQNIPLPTSINPCIQLYICTATFSHLGLSHGLMGAANINAYFCWTFSVYWIVSISMYLYIGCPLPSNSHQQDFSMFSKGFLYKLKPSFATSTGKGDKPIYFNNC